MSMPALFKGRLSIPVIGAPLFIISVPDLVIAQCEEGIIGSFPALNARPQSSDYWLGYLEALLQAGQADAAHDALALARRLKAPSSCSSAPKSDIVVGRGNVRYGPTADIGREQMR